MERRHQHRNEDQGEEEEKSAPLQSYLYKEHNGNVSVSGPMDVLHVEGHNNKIVLTGLIKKLVISGHNNQLTAEPAGEEDETMIERLTITGHNNSVDNLPCERLIINGHNNTVMVLDCTSFTVNGINNNVYNNGSEVYSQTETHHHASHEDQPRHSVRVSQSHGPRTQVHNINMTGTQGFAMPGLSVDVGDLGVEINSYVRGVLQQCGFDMGGGSGEQYEVEEVGDDASPEPEEEEYVADVEAEEAEEEPRELTLEERNEIINSFPVHKYMPGKDKTDTCSICLEKLRKYENLRTLMCMHSFHQRCVDHWLETNLICPLCRKPLIEEEEEEVPQELESQ